MDRPVREEPPEAGVGRRAVQDPGVRTPEPATSTRASVGVLDPDQMVREALTRALLDRGTLEVTHVSGEPDAILEHEKEGDPDIDIVLATRSFPDDHLLRLSRTLYKRSDGAAVVITDMEPTESVILRFMEAGMTGYVLADQGMPETVEVLEAVARGETVVSPRMARVVVGRVAELVDRYLTDGVELSYLDRLTSREAEVLELVANGLSNAEVGERLFITEGTVKTHVHNILGKLEVENREEASRYFVVARVGLSVHEESSDLV